MIVDDLCAQRIGLDWLRLQLAPVGTFGRRYDEAMPDYGPGDEAAALREIAACAALAQRLDADAVTRVRALLRSVPEPSPIAARARAGDALTDVDFYELARFADAVDALARAWDAAGGSDDARPQPVPVLQHVLAPGRTAQGFYLDDAFGAELAPARARLRAEDAAIDERRGHAAERLRAATGIAAATDEFALLRDVFDGALPDGVHVVREAPTYRLIAFTLDSTARDETFGVLATAEEAVRRELAARVAAQTDAIAVATRSLGALDRLLARVAFAQRWGACVPQSSRERIACVDAVFAPLAQALSDRGHRYTPLTFDIAGVAVLTGPNMGGKSAALATAGFVCACVALGVPPPARAATLPLFERIVWLGGDGPAERASLLSSYATEVVRGHDALAAASPAALVLIDEFARTTGPREGRALLVAVLEALHARGAFAIAATHFDRVAAAAGVAHVRIAGLRGSFETLDARDLGAALEAINTAMDYRLVDADDAVDTSDALALAQLLGLDAQVVARAHEIFARDPRD